MPIKKRSSPSITVSTEAFIDVSLSEFGTLDLVNELKSRGISSELTGQTLLDTMKIEIIQNGMQSKTIDEIERFFKS